MIPTCLFVKLGKSLDTGTLSISVLQETLNKPCVRTVNMQDAEAIKAKLKELRTRYPAASFQYIWNKALEQVPDLPEKHAASRSPATFRPAYA